MNYEEAQAQYPELVSAAKAERSSGRNKELIQLIIAQIEMHKESAIRNPTKAEEFSGSVIALRQLLSVTEHLTAEDD